MTTVAWDGYDLAADSLCTAGDVHSGFVNKIWRWNKGYFSLAGKLLQYSKVLHYLNTGKVPPPAGKFDCLIWNEEQGIMYMMNSKYDPYPAPCPMTIGMGDDAAMAVLLAGGSAKKAVKYASYVSIHTGGPIQKVSLRKKSDGKYSPDYSRLSFKSPIQQQEV